MTYKQMIATTEFVSLRRTAFRLNESGSFRPWVVSDNFWGGSFRPKKVSRFGPGSFRPLVISAKFQ